MPQAFSDIRDRTGTSAFAAGGGSAGQAILDFGTGATDTSVAITGQTGIKASSIVVACLAAVQTADHSPDEHLVEDIEVRVGAPTAGVGFTIYGRCGNVDLLGRYAVNWMWV